MDEGAVDLDLDVVVGAVEHGALEEEGLVGARGVPAYWKGVLEI